MVAFDRRRHLATIAADMRRACETIEKLNHPHDARLFAAAALLPEVASLLTEVAENRPVARVEITAR